MIKSFDSKETEQLFNRQRPKKIPRGIQRVALRKLEIINAAANIQDLRVPPGNRLEKLKGNRIHQYSTRINDQWRICFRWSTSHAYEVEIVDYHS